MNTKPSLKVRGHCNMHHLQGDNPIETQKKIKMVWLWLLIVKAADGHLFTVRIIHEQLTI